jgi:hypothetical protein
MFNTEKANDVLASCVLFFVPMMKSAACHPPELPREAGRPRWLTEETGCSGHGRSTSAVSDSIARLLALPNCYFSALLGAYASLSKFYPNHKRKT